MVVVQYSPTSQVETVPFWNGQASPSANTSSTWHVPRTQTPAFSPSGSAQVTSVVQLRPVSVVPRSTLHAAHNDLRIVRFSCQVGTQSAFASAWAARQGSTNCGSYTAKPAATASAPGRHISWTKVATQRSW